METVPIIIEPNDINRFTYCEPGAATSRNIVMSDNTQIVLRTSNYAKFASTILPSGEGDIYGILTIYNTTPQLIIRSLADVRISGGGVNPGTAETLYSVDFSSNPLENQGWTVQGDAGWFYWTGGPAFAIQNQNSNVIDSWLVSPAISGLNSYQDVFVTVEDVVNASANGLMEMYYSTSFNGTNFDANSWTMFNRSQPSASTRFGSQLSYVDGSSYTGFAYFFSAEKRINSEHALNLSFWGSPTSRSLQSNSTQEVYDLTGDHYYNSNWGWYDGKKRNARIRKTYEPVFMLSHFYTPQSGKYQITTNLGSSFGRQSTTSLNWADVPDPRPDYYRYLPSYITDDTTLQAWYTDQWLHNRDFRQLDWDHFYEVNQLAAANGERSQYILENRVIDHVQVSGATNVVTNLTDHIKLAAGVDIRGYHQRNYKTINDLLGGAYWLNAIFTVSTTETAEAGTYQFFVETGRTTCGIYIARLTLTVNPVYDARFGYAEVEDVVCEGQPYQGYGFALSADSILTLRDMYQTQVYGDIVVYNYDETEYACDSVTRLTLHVLPKVYADTTIHRCTSLLPYLYAENGQEFAVDGDTTVNVLYQQVANGCDSIRRVTIVFDPMPVMEVLGTEICANAETGALMLAYTNDNQANVDSIKWYINNEVSSTDDRLELTLADFESDLAVEVYAGACVFTPTVSIVVIDNPEVHIDTTICEGVTYVAPDGTEFTQATDDEYDWYVTDENGGCDIHYFLNLSVNPTYNIEVERTIDVTELPYVWNGVTFDTAGTQSVRLTASTGCDSTVTMILWLNPTMGGNSFMVSEQVGDNEFSLTAFANTTPLNTKVAIAYSVYKDGNLVNNIEADCGGELYIGTEWLNSYVGDVVYATEGYIPANTFRIGVNYFDYFYFHFLNGRDNRITHTFTEPGEYEIVFTLMSREW